MNEPVTRSEFNIFQKSVKEERHDFRTEVQKYLIRMEDRLEKVCDRMDDLNNTERLIKLESEFETIKIIIDKYKTDTEDFIKNVLDRQYNQQKEFLHSVEGKMKGLEILLYITKNPKVILFLLVSAYVLLISDFIEIFLHTIKDLI